MSPLTGLGMAEGKLPSRRCLGERSVFRTICTRAKSLKLLLEALQFLVAQILQIYKAGAGASDASEKFIQL